MSTIYFSLFPMLGNFGTLFLRKPLYLLLIMLFQRLPIALFAIFNTIQRQLVKFLFDFFHFLFKKVQNLRHTGELFPGFSHCLAPTNLLRINHFPVLITHQTNTSII